MTKWNNLVASFNEDKKLNAVNCVSAQVEFNKEHNNGAAFKRCSIPIIIRTMSESKAFNCNNFDLGEEASEVYMFETRFQPPQTEPYNLQSEADYVAKFSAALLREFDELFSDQYNKYITFQGLECTESGNMLIHYNFN